MENRGLDAIGGLLTDSLASRLHGFDSLGSDSIDTLPAPDALRYGLFSFVAQVDNPTVSFSTGGQTNTIYWPDGTTQGTGAFNARTLTGVTAGDALTVQLAVPLKFGFANITATGGLGDFEVFWEALTDSTNLELRDYGITRPILSTMTNTITNFDLRGNSVGGDFPDGLQVTRNLYLQDNNFTGGLPTFRNEITRYQVNGNGFRGDIPDISSSTSINSFLCYNQNDDGRASPSNPRIMLTGTIPDLSGCTNLTFYHVGAGPSWVRGFKNDLSVALDFDVGVKMAKFFASNCQLSTADVDRILAAFAAKAGTFTNPTTIDLSGSNGVPTSVGLSNAATLIANGWTVQLPANSGAIPPIIYTVKGRVAGNASFAQFSNGNRIDDQPPFYDLIIEVEAGGDVNLTYSSQNDFDEFRIDSGTVGSSAVDATNFVLTNVQSDIECQIFRTD